MLIGGKSMKVLVTGVNGQLGYDVMNELNQRGHEAIGSDITESNEHFQKYVQLDITNKEAVELQKSILMLLFTVQHGLLLI